MLRTYANSVDRRHTRTHSFTQHNYLYLTLCTMLETRLSCLSHTIIEQIQSAVHICGRMRVRAHKHISTFVLKLDFRSYIHASQRTPAALSPPSLLPPKSLSSSPRPVSHTTRLAGAATVSRAAGRESFAQHLSLSSRFYVCTHKHISVLSKIHTATHTH